MARVLNEQIQGASTFLRARLPKGWNVLPADGAGNDVVLEITSPDQRRARVAVEVKQTVAGRDVVLIAESLADMRSRNGAGNSPLVARYVPPSVRERLWDMGVSFVEATGNARVALADPAVFIAERG